VKFLVIVKTPITNAYSAFKFIEAAISLKHIIVTVFFDQQGVNLANAYINWPQDEINIQQNWQALAIKHSIPLVVCSASALRYGVSLDKFAEQFVIGSLGQLTEIIATVDRVVTFK
jgi:tRNA 2-thiouridine synthesizing protein D